MWKIHTFVSLSLTPTNLSHSPHFYLRYLWVWWVWIFVRIHNLKYQKYKIQHRTQVHTHTHSLWWLWVYAEYYIVICGYSCCKWPICVRLLFHFRLIRITNAHFHCVFMFIQVINVGADVIADAIVAAVTAAVVVVVCYWSSCGSVILRVEYIQRKISCLRV